MAKLIGHNMQPAEYKRNTWRVNVPADTDYKELFVPSFWANVAIKLVRGDVIEVFAEDGSWYAELLVRVQARTHAQVEELLYKNFGEKAEQVAENTALGSAKSEGAAPTVAWKGPNLKYSVVRHDGVYLKNGFETKQEAQDWADANAEALV